MDRETMREVYDAAMSEFDHRYTEQQFKMNEALRNGDRLSAGQFSIEMSKIETDRLNYDHNARRMVAAIEAAPRPDPHGLNADQHEHAAICGVDPETYAEGVRQCYADGRFSFQNGMTRR